MTRRLSEKEIERIVDGPEVPQHPFQPGTRVAIQTAIWDGECIYREAFVDRIYKNGRFLLRGSDQQWKASHNLFDDTWRADRTDDRRWYRDSVLLWDEKNGAEIEASRAREALWKRACKIRKRLEDMKREQITAAMLDAIEEALGEGATS